MPFAFCRHRWLLVWRLSRLDIAGKAAPIPAEQHRLTGCVENAISEIKRQTCPPLSQLLRYSNISLSSRQLPISPYCNRQDISTLSLGRAAETRVRPRAYFPPLSLARLSNAGKQSFEARCGDVQPSRQHRSTPPPLYLPGLLLLGVDLVGIELQQSPIRPQESSQCCLREQQPGSWYACFVSSISQPPTCHHDAN